MNLTERLAQQQQERQQRIHALTGYRPPQTPAELEALRHPRVTQPNPGAGHDHPTAPMRPGGRR